MELVLVNTPPKYGDKWWTDNILHMLKGNLDIDDVHIIDNIEFGGVYDKLRIFDICKSKNVQYLYLDLDILIKGDIRHLARKKFTLLHAWWRRTFHTPLNSSIMSWQGNCSHIYDIFMKDPDYYMLKYHKGIDEFIYKEVQYEVYDKVCDSYNWPTDNEYAITLFNQAKDEMRKQKYSL